MNIFTVCPKMIIILCVGNLFSFRNIRTMVAVIKNESLVPIIPGMHLLNIYIRIYFN